ncbi:MAG: D-tagatose-bisphosphate aldolase class accessory protein AgaZ [Clostridiales bacterium]|jgi:D-tagatose-1,6-bisphosphate aldolase subunit GatZ/KbaZ|nr:D-tagatose-bisphosphate aldolase class accessory protein AgaZ [Clostridiales bacterium]
MYKEHPLQEIVKLQKAGIPAGIYSICSANEYVITAALERALKANDFILIEATANQVNQYGGYTGMKPADFKNFVYSIANKIKFPIEKIILGGDHLGPLTWKSRNSAAAMEEAKELIKLFVLSGFTKIHIDTSMHLGDDDKEKRLDTKTIAERGSLLAEVAEKAYDEIKKSNANALHPVYVVGSEVPIPGGSQAVEDKMQITRVEDLYETIEEFKKAFNSRGIEYAWDNVIAVVVQPGVEFGEDSIHEYNREAAKQLCDSIKNYPNLIFEGHSTDYQTPKALKEMVEDGIAILKVGPALTFALREGLFALNYIEEELFRDKEDVLLSEFKQVLEDEMLTYPQNWETHYHGDNSKLKMARKYSFSDRCRYYMPSKRVAKAIDRLINNLRSVDIPLTLISQFMPIQYTKILSGSLKKDTEHLLKDRVVNCIDGYLAATNDSADIG